MMNEKIKELAEQASHQSPCGYPVTIIYNKDFAEKFAELIVNECAQFILVLDAEPVSHKSAASMLQEHFGIEE